MADIAAADSLAEINAQRIAAGLAPIDESAVSGEGGEPQVDEDEVAAQNYAQRKDEMRRAKEEQDIKERIAKAKNQRALNEKLKGTTLATADKEDLDNKAWLRKLAKRQKKHAQELAAKKAKELEDKYADTYGEEDLSGLKVGHKTDDFEAGEDTILTLKDSGVLAGDEDELVNVNMVDKQKDRELRETRKKGLEKYSGYDDEEFDENRIGTKAEVLSKYNDEFSTGKVRSEGFRLGAPTEQKRKADEEDEMMTIGQAPKTMVKLNLDFAKDFEVSDYMREGDKGFKARKPKKAKRSVRKQEDAEDGEGMEVDGEPTFAKRVVDETPQNLVDDDDMQAALARQRRENAKKRPKVKVEDLAARIASQRQEEETQPRENGDEDGRITFDDTSEFVRNVALESRVAPVKRERAASPPVAGPSRSAEPEVPVVVKIEREEGAVDEDEDMDSEDEDEALAEMAAREGLSLAEYRIKIDAQMAEMEQVKREGEEAASTEEAVVGNGMAGVLNLLRQQGALKKRTAEEEERERVQKQRDLWLADYRRRQAERELERIQARGGNKDQAQREWENRMREQNEAKDALEVYKNYKPDINIVYHDEFGREMTPKEAWKSLSHKFHGKTSGRMKTEKRLKKIAEERKQLQMSAGDTPLGMTDAFARRQQKTGQAHMILSVGNKGSVQSAEQKPKIRR